MLKAHMHVGCNVYEIQCQKEEQQCFQETAKVRDFFLWLVSVRRLLWSHLLSAPQLFAQGTYEYGCQLLTAALALRQSCKLPTVSNSQLSENLWNSWKRLQSVGQEQMTRLRVSAVYHRSVQEVRHSRCEFWATFRLATTERSLWLVWFLCVFGGNTFSVRVRERERHTICL
jgi:hypothetical protein